MAIYYVKNGGSDGLDGLSDANAWATVSKVNGFTFAAGDTIKFKCGSTWREELVYPRSGTVGAPLTVDSYDTGALPIITGADLGSSGWSDAGGNVWQKSVTTQPRIVLFNTTLGTLVADVGSVNSANEWFWAANVLSVYSTSDPATAFTAPGIQYGQRSHAVSSDAKDYITITNIDAQCGNHASNGTVQLGVASGGTGVGYTVTNVTVRFGAGDGIMFTAFPAVATLTASTIRDNTISDVGRNGIQLFQVNATAGNENLISGNTITRAEIAGIEQRGNYAIIEHNTLTTVGDLAQIGGGIHVYSGSIGEGTGDNNTIRFNVITDAIGHANDGYGIACDQWCDDNVIHHNVVNGSDGPGIYLFDADGCAIYHNTVYDACQDTAGDGAERGGIRLTSSASPNNLCANALVKNNICVVSATGAVAVMVDADTVLNAATLTITNNDWYRASGNWYDWNGVAGANLTTWNAFTGVGTDLNADPLFVNPAAGDFHLKATSPCKNAGVLIPGMNADFDGVGVPIGPAPDIGAFEERSTLLHSFAAL